MRPIGVVYLSLTVTVLLSVREQDNSRTRLRMSTKHGRNEPAVTTYYILVLIRIRTWISDHFSTFPVRHDKIYADSQEGATAFLRNTAAALAR